MKKEEYGYCLLHNCKLTKQQVYEKCRFGNKRRPRCRHLLILNKEIFKGERNNETFF